MGPTTQLLRTLRTGLSQCSNEAEILGNLCHRAVQHWGASQASTWRWNTSKSCLEPTASHGSISALLGTQQAKLQALLSQTQPTGETSWAALGGALHALRLPDTSQGAEALVCDLPTAWVNDTSWGAVWELLALALSRVAPQAAAIGPVLRATQNELQAYAEVFERAADGMVIVDEAGRILLSNPRATELTGYARGELEGALLSKFLGRRQRAQAVRLAQGFAKDTFPRGVDFRFARRRGVLEAHRTELTLNVSFSPVLGPQRAILITFRDVTEERKIDIELKRTKEFLERVIDSSVDAIVSADLHGRVLLFNRAAARIFGYEPDDVIGKMRVDRLYPKGIARQVMQMIRGPSHGGPRRLEDYRVEMQGSQGEPIAVNISAALIMDGDTPIGSVGVFTDVREKLIMESRLNDAREELKLHEKSVALAELAGAAAHELNQPLTAVLGYAELLERHLDQPDRLGDLASSIVSESERMATIVRKIGRITRYETRGYVGETNILDLEKAAPDSEDPD